MVMVNDHFHGIVTVTFMVTVMLMAIRITMVYVFVIVTDTVKAIGQLDMLM